MNLKLSQPDSIISFGNYRLDFSKKTCLMGILNVTPDSFSDGGLFYEREKAIARGIEIGHEGASIIDVGGESARPGSESVSAEEELRRVIPVIAALSSKVHIPISIDTSKPVVAREAIKAGASMINNIMGADLDKEMALVSAKFDVPMVLMHMKGEPRSMQDNPVYEDVVLEIITALKESIEIAENLGIDPKKLIIDPGIGFGKTYWHNIEILKRLKEFKILNKPILVGPSRKSFIGTALGIKNPSERLMGTVAAVAIAISNGADIVRVHDVKEVSRVAAMVDGVYKKCSFS